MKTLKYYLLDVFTNKPFGGNQLAVFLDGSNLSARQMQTIAKELNLSETVFLHQSREYKDTFKLRIFTPETELPFAGHPTIGTAYLLADLGLVKTNDGLTEIKVEENIGLITIHIYAEKQKVIKADMFQPIPQVVEKKISTNHIAQLLTLKVEDLHPDLPIQIVSSGIPFVYVPVKTLQAMNNIKFRMDIWNEHFSTCEETKHIFAFSLETENPDSHVHSRMFAPAMGISEDPATGSASGPLGFYLAIHEAIKHKEGQFHLISEQGIEMGRPSKIEVTLTREEGTYKEVKIGGSALIMGEGVLYLPS